LTSPKLNPKGSGRHLLLAFIILCFVGAVLFVFNASKAGQQVEGCPQGCSTHPLDGDDTLRVISLNMLHGHPDFENLKERMDLIAAEINQQDADIVLLQEVPWTRGLGSGAEYISTLTGMNHIYLRANGNRNTILFEEGSAILSRYPLSDTSFTELSPQAGFFEHRIVLHAAAATPFGEVDVFVTHLTHGSPEVNLQQTLNLLDFVKNSRGELTIIAGDFNAVEDSPQIQYLNQHWVDAYRTANPNRDGPTCCIEDLSNGPDEPLEKRIDYIFLSADPAMRLQGIQRVFGEPFRMEYGWQWASDHIGLMAVFKP